MDPIAVDIRVLGPLEVTCSGELVGPAGAKRRGLLALLAVEANHVVPLAVLVDRLWGEDPPATAANVVQTYVSTWRKALEPGRRRGDDRRLETVGAGYRLRLDVGESDLLRFGTLAARGWTFSRDGEHARAAEVLHGALGLWRGPALPELTGEPFHGPVTRELAERRLQVLEDWASETLTAGLPDASAVVDALVAARLENPWRERLTELLMWALAGLGRQADALSAFEQTRGLLAEELGADPGPALRQMHLRVLQQDLELASPGASATVGRPARQQRLQPRMDTFVGRERELKELADLLEDHRLVTLTGPGGSGKTRLAEQVLAVSGERFAAGAVLVELAAVRDASLLPSLIGLALGLPEQAGSDPLQPVIDYLSERSVLVVLDNLEHLPDAAPVVDRLHRHTKTARLLATSREPLRLTGEQLYPVPPLPLPQAGPHAAGQLADNAAVRLFAERVRAIDPSFDVSASNAADVVAIIARLDGLPLALEIAAPWLPVLSSAGLLARLDHSLDVSSRTPTADPRHRSMRDTITWGYQLLPPDSQRLLDVMSVFRGGACLDSIEAICGDRDAGSPIVERLAGLVETNLLQAAPPVTGQPRFRILETIREYAAERLRDNADANIVRSRHAAHFADLAEQISRLSEGPDGVRWLARTRADADNLRAAMDHYVSTNQGAAALQVVTDCAALWWDLGFVVEGLDRYLVSLGLAPEDAPARPMGHVMAGWLAAAVGRHAQAEEHVGRGADLAHSRGDVLVEAFATQTMGMLVQDDHERCLATLMRALALAEQGKDLPVRHAETAPAAVAGGAAHSLCQKLKWRNLPQAQRWVEVSLEWGEREGYPPAIAFNKGVLGEVMMRQGDLATAQTLLDAADAELREADVPIYREVILRGLAELAHMHGDLDTAERLSRDVLQLTSELGVQNQKTADAGRLADVLIDAGRPEEARQVLDELGAAGGLGPRLRPALLVRRARVARLAGRVQDASVLLAEADLDLDPDELRPERVIWYVESAHAALERGEPVAATELLNRADEHAGRVGLVIPLTERRRLDALRAELTVRARSDSGSTPS